MSNDRAENAAKRHAALYLHLANRYSWTPAQVNEIDPVIRSVMAKVLGLPPLDDEGTAGTSEPNTPEPTPVMPTTYVTPTPNGVTITVNLDGKSLYETAFRQQRQYQKHNLA